MINSATTEPVIWVDGREHLLFCSNNLPGLSNHPDVKKTAGAALERYGLGSGGSRPMAPSTWSRMPRRRGPNRPRAG